MNKKSLLKILSVVAFLMTLVLFAACKTPDTEISLTYLASLGGEIIGEVNQAVECGASGTEVTAQAYEGYEFVEWSDGVTTPSRIDENITNDITVTAKFSKLSYTVSYTTDGNGIIQGNSNQKVEYGLSGTEVIALPNEGYRFVSWSDGVTTPIRQDNVKNTISVEAMFEGPVEVQIGFYANHGGRIEGQTFQRVVYGGKGTPVTAVPDKDYHFVRWSDGDTNATKTNEKVLTRNGDYADIFYAEFELNNFVTVNYITDEGGILQGELFQTIEIGGDTTPVEVQTEIGYKFIGWMVESGFDGDNSVRTDRNVTSSITVRAVISSLLSSRFHFIARDGGRIEGEARQEVLYNDNGSPVEAVADEGYRFVKWSDGQTDAIRDMKKVDFYNQTYVCYAEFERYERNFKLEYNEATINSEIKNIILNLDNFENTKLPIPQREGFIFEGWFSDWHLSTQLANENGDIVMSKEKFQNELFFDVYYNPQGYLYAKWSAMQEPPIFKVLMVFVTEIHATLRKERYIVDHSKIPSEIIDDKVEYIKVDYRMTDIEKRMCECIAVYFEQYLNAALNANVKFVVDTYFTSQTLTEENLVPGQQSFPYDRDKRQYVIVTDYLTDARWIPEVKELANEYKSVITTFCMNDYDVELHFAAGGAGAKYAFMHFEVMGGSRSDPLSIFNKLFNDEKLFYRYIQNYLDFYIHEFCHTIEFQLDEQDYYGIHEASLHYSQTVSIDHSEFNVSVPYLRGKYNVGDKFVGIPIEFWKGEYFER